MHLYPAAILDFIKRKIRYLLRSRYFDKTVAMRGEVSSREGLQRLIDSWGEVQGLVVAEIGSYSGESAEIFLASGKVRRLYCVDPWRNFYDKNDVAAMTDMARIERIFDKRVGNDPRVVKIKGTIDDLVAQIRNDSQRVDIVYVDGCHTYDAVTYDIQTAVQHIRPRIICGHDFTEAWAGCRQAVLDTVGAPDKTFSDTSWMKTLTHDDKEETL